MLFRSQFVQRIAIKKYPKDVAGSFEAEALRQALGAYATMDDEHQFAMKILSWLADSEHYQIELDLASQ